MGVRIERKVGPKGQVVIPHQIRRDFGISPGTEVEFDVEENKIVIEPKLDKRVVEMFEEDSKKSDRRSSELTVGDELYEKIFRKT